VAQSDISILINGESGTGKEIFANALHEASPRSSLKNDKCKLRCNSRKVFWKVNFFGHEKGSFTGASDTRKDISRSPIIPHSFLDEIGEMPLTTQVKLLRVLETNEFMKLGSEKVTNVNVSIIAASNKNLQDEVDKHNFSNDLYFRLKAVTLQFLLYEKEEKI
jgi:two-component system NtrC family response regulator